MLTQSEMTRMRVQLMEMRDEFITILGDNTALKPWERTKITKIHTRLDQAITTLRSIDEWIAALRVGRGK